RRGRAGTGAARWRDGRPALRPAHAHSGAAFRRKRPPWSTAWLPMELPCRAWPELRGWRWACQAPFSLSPTLRRTDDAVMALSTLLRRAEGTMSDGRATGDNARLNRAGFAGNLA